MDTKHFVILIWFVSGLCCGWFVHGEYTAGTSKAHVETNDICSLDDIGYSPDALLLKDEYPVVMYVGYSVGDLDICESDRKSLGLLSGFACVSKLTYCRLRE